MQYRVASILKYLGYGSAVISRLMKTSIKKNLYYEIKDRAFEERTNGISMVRQTAKYKIYGLDSTKVIRARLIELLYERVAYHKDKFIAPIIHDEMQAMEVKKNGKVEHSSQSHDDQVFSYLMALYVWYDGVNLNERFNIQKNTIRTDESLEEAIVSLEDLDGGVEMIDITTEVIDDTQPILKDQLEIIDKALKTRICENIYQIQDEDDAIALAQVLSTEEGLRAYNKSRNFDPDAPAMYGMTDIANRKTIPDSVFDDFNSDSDPEYSIYQGNLDNIFNQL